MAIGLQNLDNVDEPSEEYPYGKPRDNDGTGNGTPANVKTLGDFHQFFARLLAQAGITANNLPENNTNGFQYNQALQIVINVAVQEEAVIRQEADSDLQQQIGDASTIMRENPIPPNPGIDANDFQLGSMQYAQGSGDLNTPISSERFIIFTGGASVGSRMQIAIQMSGASTSTLYTRVRSLLGGGTWSNWTANGI